MTPVDEFFRRALAGRPEPPPVRWTTAPDPDNPDTAALDLEDAATPERNDP